MTHAFLFLATVLALSACDSDAPPQAQSQAQTQPQAQAQIEPEVAPTPAIATPVAGPRTRVPAVPAEEMGTAADISQFHALPSLNAKVFSLSGGDPAVNGLVTYFALFGGPSEGWRTYPLGDYAEWRVVEAGVGRVALAVRQDTAGPEGDVLTANWTVRIDFAWDGETPPDAVDVSITQ